ncbi:MAG: polysaccharide deacetylase family protein [Actinocatenispora sp.]
MAAARYPWPRDTRSALCVTFDFDGEAPYLWRNRATGGDGAAELEQRRYGPRRGVYNVLGMLDELRITATFFVPGWIVAHHPAAVREIHEQGHELALHGWCHEPPTELDAVRLSDTLQRAVGALSDITGVLPVGYRSPSFQMTPEAIDVLIGLGLRYDSSLMGDDRPYRIGDLVEVPVDWATDDAPYYRYRAGDPRPPMPAGQLAAAWATEIDAARLHGTLCMLTMHPWLSGRPARIDQLTQVLAGVVADPDLWVGSVAALAEHHRLLGPPDPTGVSGWQDVDKDSIGWPDDNT